MKKNETETLISELSQSELESINGGHSPDYGGALGGYVAGQWIQDFFVGFWNGVMS